VCVFVYACVWERELFVGQKNQEQVREREGGRERTSEAEQASKKNRGGNHVFSSRVLCFWNTCSFSDTWNTCMCVYIYIYIYTCICIDLHIHVYIHVHMYIYTNICMYACICKYTNACISCISQRACINLHVHTFVSVCLPGWLFVCVRACVRTCVCACACMCCMCVCLRMRVYVHASVRACACMQCVCVQSKKIAQHIYNIYIYKCLCGSGAYEFMCLMCTSHTHAHT